MEWKRGISQIPCGMAEQRRKCGIIPPKAEWLACLIFVTGAAGFQRPDTIPVGSSTEAQECRNVNKQQRVNELTELSTVVRQSMRVCSACIASSSSSNVSGRFANSWHLTNTTDWLESVKHISTPIPFSAIMVSIVTDEIKDKKAQLTQRERAKAVHVWSPTANKCKIRKNLYFSAQGHSRSLLSVSIETRVWLPISD